MFLPALHDQTASFSPQFYNSVLSVASILGFIFKQGDYFHSISFFLPSAPFIFREVGNIQPCMKTCSYPLCQLWCLKHFFSPPLQVDEDEASRFTLSISFVLLCFCYLTDNKEPSGKEEALCLKIIIIKKKFPDCLGQYHVASEPGDGIACKTEPQCLIGGAGCTNTKDIFTILCLQTLLRSSFTRGSDLP